MSSKDPAHSHTFIIAAAAIGTIFIGFGLNGMLRPEQALSFFGFDPPALLQDKKVVNALVVVESARDVFMGLAIYAASYHGHRKALGWIVIAAGLVAFVDGAVCLATVGQGHWVHWGYAPVVTIIGALGILD
ncbi:hypothetical protein LTR84_009759 [Exophiala bonariae]|uniref:Integral membrane protein n=1 Tax=Exophiala bonariae TaxID=1690606 RepID=A0AAV9NNF2_9EURO|nr:hypothetical protein LTR84_009759 [Exophiala bonariae]